MSIIRKWIRGIADTAIAENQKARVEKAPEPGAMDGKTEDGLLLCYAWERKLIGAEDALRRVRLWQKDHDPDAIPRTDAHSLYFEWAITALCYWSSNSFTRMPDTALRDRIRQIALEADAQIKAASHRAAQKALKEAAK